MNRNLAMLLLLCPSFAWGADAPPATEPSAMTSQASVKVTLPFGMVSTQRIETGSAFSKLEGLELSEVKVFLRSGSGLEALRTTSLQGLLEAASGAGVAAIKVDEPMEQTRGMVATAPANQKLNGTRVAAALKQVTLRLAPVTTPRAVVVMATLKDGQQITVALTIDAVVAPTHTLDVEQTAEELTFPTRGEYDGGKGYDLTTRTLQIGTYLHLAEAGTLEQDPDVSITKIRVRPGVADAEAEVGNLLGAGDVLCANEALIEEKVDEEDPQRKGSFRSCKQPVLSIESSFDSGMDLNTALATLSEVNLITKHGFNPRHLKVEAEWTIRDGTTTRTAWFDLLSLSVRPELPALPEACARVGLYRDGRGLRLAQGAHASRVLRYDEVLEAAKIRASLKGKQNKVCKGFWDLYEDEDLTVTLAVSGEVKTDIAQLKADDPTLFGAAAPPPVKNGGQPSSSLPFFASYDEIHTKNDPKYALPTTPDGAYHLYAHALLTSKDGENRRLVRPNVDINAMVDLAPLWTVEVVNHPISTALTFLTCRDLAGLEGAAAEDAACDQTPDRILLSASVSTIPLGLRARWTPVYQASWFGLAAEANFLSMGASSIVSDSYSKDRTTTGINAPVSLLAGLDVNGEFANGTGAVANKVGFMLFGGINFVEGAEGIVPRASAGISIGVRALELSGRKAASTTDTAETPAEDTAAGASGASDTAADAATTTTTSTTTTPATTTATPTTKPAATPTKPRKLRK